MDTTTTTSTKISFNNIPIHNLTPLHVPEIHIADESMNKSPEMVDLFDTDLSATLSAHNQQQPPALPGLIRNCPVPPPIPMQWQLTVPSESELELDDFNLSTMSMGMDGDREIVLSPDDHNDIFMESHSSTISFSQLPDMHGLHNSSSNHSNYSNSSHSSMSSLSSLTSLSSISHSSIPYINDLDHHTITSHSPLQPMDNNNTLKLKEIKLIPIIDDNKFETNRDTIYDTLCQFEDGSSVEDDKNIDNNNNNTESDKCNDKLSTKYELKHNLLMNGFIRDLQKEIKQIIPTEINKICSEFYYEKEQKYIHLTYSIHNHHQHILRRKANVNNDNDDEHEMDEFRDRPWRQNTFSGKELIEMMDDMDIKCNYNDLYFGSITMEKICDHLIEYGLIECVSYKTHFSALFTSSNSNSISSSLINWDKHQFKSSHDYLYNFTQNALSAIKQFNKSHSH